jgi:ATP-dependent helicase/nuclease subunit B
MARGLFEAANSGRVILAPNAELAAALYDAVERMHLAAGHTLWPTPRIRDFGSWARECHAVRQLADASLPRVLSDVEERELWRTVILESPAGPDLLEPSGAASSARSARRALIEYAIPTAALMDDAAEESLALLDWNRRFEKRCTELRCVAADQLIQEVALDSHSVAWLESPIWRPLARRRLEMSGAEVLPALSPGAPAQPRRLQAGSAAEELAAIAEHARAGLQCSDEYRAWICIPDLNLRRAAVADAFDAALAPQRFLLTGGDAAAAYAIAGGTPLADHPPVRAALDALAAAQGSVSFEKFSALLRTPEIQESPADAGAAAAVDLALRRRGPDAATLPKWLALADRLTREKSLTSASALRRLHGFVQSLGTARGSQRMSRWVCVWIDAFESGPWALRARWSSGEFQAAERFRELLAALATADEVFGTLSVGSAGRVLARAARDTAFQAQTGIPPVWISGQIMDPWLTYDAIWMAACSDLRWPPPVDPIPLLPVRLQREYGVIAASAEHQLKFAEDLQERWLRRAPLAVFSCSDAEDGRPTAMSPLVPAAGAEPAHEAVVHPHWRAQAERAPSLEELIDERAPSFAGTERTHGVGTLRAQSRCAFRGFAETRLSAESLEKPTPGFSRRERGELLHHALEHIWSDLHSSVRLAALAPDDRAAVIRAGVNFALTRQCVARDPGVRWQQREVPRLSALIDKWLTIEGWREPFEVERLEQQSETAHHGGLEFAVRIDRIDRLADGARVIIDYKTGVATPDWRGDRPDNPQLPIYALLHPEALVAVAYGKVNAAKCDFVAESERRGIFKANRPPAKLEGMPDFAALVALWGRRIEKIAAEFAAGWAAVAPTLNACASCQLQTLCRVPVALDDDGMHDE